MFKFGFGKHQPKQYRDFEDLADKLGEEDGTEVLRARRFGSKLLYASNPNKKQKLTFRRWFPGKRVNVQGPFGPDTVTVTQRALMKNQWGSQGAVGLLIDQCGKNVAHQILATFQERHGRCLHQNDISTGDLWKLQQIKSEVVGSDTTDRQATSKGGAAFNQASDDIRGSGNEPVPVSSDDHHVLTGTNRRSANTAAPSQMRSMKPEETQRLKSMIRELLQPEPNKCFSKEIVASRAFLSRAYDDVVDGDQKIPDAIRKHKKVKGVVDELLGLLKQAGEEILQSEKTMLQNNPELSGKGRVNADTARKIINSSRNIITHVNTIQSSNISDDEKEKAKNIAKHIIKNVKPILDAYNFNSPDGHAH